MCNARSVVGRMHCGNVKLNSVSFMDTCRTSFCIYCLGIIETCGKLIHGVLLVSKRLTISKLILRNE
jgi:hypothetical protein